jgi:class 3 adenylate cyclase/tetratricopeptide (TPR) repeat protein
MTGSRHEEARDSGKPQDLESSARDAPRAFVLTLDPFIPGRLLAMLGDGRWANNVANAEWPPQSSTALPASTIDALRRVAGASLVVQLRVALDAWPWERELAAAGIAAVVPRYLIDLPDPTQDVPVHAPLVATWGAEGEHLALVQAARLQRRPLVLADAALSAEQRLVLERGLRSHWRGPQVASQALARALTQLGLPTDCCRLYGDGLAPLADAEHGWRPATVLSIDLVKSTQLLLTLGAEAYAQRLQGYYERCRDVVVRFGGSLDDPHGDDGLMAYFGFPLAVEDAATRALTVAWQLSRGLTDQGMSVRIGVASGQVAVNAQQPFGEDVHLAARLSAAAEPGEILVAPSTRERGGATFQLERCTKVLNLKDYGSQNHIYRLDGILVDSPGHRLSRSPVGSFVGRQRELARLREAWAHACSGHLQWCVVQGEAGIGKSRLLHEFERELRKQDVRCVEIVGHSHASTSAFAAVVDALRRHWAVVSSDDPEGVAVAVPPALEELAHLIAPQPGDRPPADAPEQRHLGDLLLQGLQSLLAPGPLCLLVDDAHWLDPSSIELLRRLCEANAHCPVLIVSGERIESGRALTPPGSAVMQLHGLNEHEARELVTRLGGAVPARMRQRIIERAEGVPLYLEESLRMLDHAGAPTARDVPATLEDLLMVRLDGLGPERALAQVISVLGRECDADELQALLQQDDPFVERARRLGSLGALLDSGLLQAQDGPPPGYRFKHVLVRDVAYGSIWMHDRRRLHGLCADLIERAAAQGRPQRPERLAQHLQAAGRVGPAWRAWRAAAQLAAARHAHQETVDLAQRALALLAQESPDAERARSEIHLQLLIASAHIALLGYGSGEVESAYLAAERASDRLGDAAPTLRIRLGLEACFVMRGDLARAGEIASRAVAATSWQDDMRLALQSRWARANVQFHQGDWRSAQGGFDDCLAHYDRSLHRPSGVQDPAVMCLGYSSWIHFELGQADEALRRIDRMLALADELQHPFSSSVAFGFAASVKRLCGDTDGAWPHAQAAVEVCERGGFQVWLAHAFMVRGQMRSDRGDTGGDTDLDRGYALWVGSGARISCATYLITRAEILLRQGRTARAIGELAQAWQISEQIGEHYYQAELLRLRGLAAWQGGDLGGAEVALHQSLALASRQGKPGLQLRSALSLGALQASQGRSAEAAARLRGVLQPISQHGSCRDMRWAHKALACWEEGRPFATLKTTPWEPT